MEQNNIVDNVISCILAGCKTTKDICDQLGLSFEDLEKLKDDDKFLTPKDKKLSRHPDTWVNDPRYIPGLMPLNEWELTIRGNEYARTNEIKPIEYSISEKKISFPNDIIKKAKDILDNKDPLYYCCKTVEKYHKGDYSLIALNQLITLTPWIKVKPLHSYPVGNSGKGKSDLISKILLTYHPNYWITLTSSSPKAPYYAYRDGELTNRQIIFFDDVYIDKSGIDTVKAFTSGGMIKPQLWSVNDKRKLLKVDVKGSYSVILTSVNPIDDPQLKNRFIVQNPDQSSIQDDRVWLYQDISERKGSEIENIKSDMDFDVCKAITHILCSENDHVIIPFKINWKYKKDRRLYPFFLTIIKAVTKFYKYQRKRTDDGNIITTKGDFQIARLIWKGIELFQKTKTDQNAQNVLSVIKKDKMTYEDICRETKLATTQVKTACYELLGMGLINSDKDGRRNVFWRIPSVQSVQSPSNKQLDDKMISDDIEFDPSIQSSWGVTNIHELKKYVFETTTPKDARMFIETAFIDSDLSVQKTIGQIKTDETNVESKIIEFCKNEKQDVDIVKMVRGLPNGSLLKDDRIMSYIEKMGRQGLLLEISPGVFKRV